MRNGFELEEFLASEEAHGLSATEPERREVAIRLRDSLIGMDRALPQLAVEDLHEWLFHELPILCDPGDPLNAHVAATLRALFRFAKLERLGRQLDEALPELEFALEHGHSHHPHAHDDEPQEPYVRGEPKIGRNDPCPCGSGRKFKKCHGG